MNSSLRCFLATASLYALLGLSPAMGSVIITTGPLPSTEYETAQGEWSLVEDPPHPNTSASGNILTVTGRAAVLSAFEEVPSGVDIGYASLGGDVASARKGFYFDPSSSFVVAIDFDLYANSSVGAGAIGFGIGEDADGMDSAGVGMGFVNGAPLAFSTAGRVGDVDIGLGLFATAATAKGRFFVEYDSLSKNVILGVSTTQGAFTPMETKEISAIGAQWDNEPLLVSFFLRSQSISIFPALSSGQILASFSNFEVLSGTPIAIPEPTASVLAILGVLAVRKRTR